MEKESRCPVTGKTGARTTATDSPHGSWWPHQLNLRILHQNSPAANPMGEEFNYNEEFNQLNLEALK